MDYPIGFYVYQLVDPRCGKPFYAGKGQRKRAWEHEKQVRQGNPGSNRRKVAIIQEIIDAGLHVDIQIVQVYDLESEALDHEFRLVDADPALVNAVPGGQGQGLAQKEADRRAAARLIRLRKLRERERREAAHADLLVRRDSFLKKARTDAERAAVLAWLNDASGDAARRLLAPKTIVVEQKERREAANRLRLSHIDRPNRKSRQFGRRYRGPAEINPADYVLPAAE